MLFQRMHTSEEDKSCACALLLWFLELCVWGGHVPHLPWVAHCCLPDWFLQMSGERKSKRNNNSMRICMLMGRSGLPIRGHLSSMIFFTLLTQFFRNECSLLVMSMHH